MRCRGAILLMLLLAFACKENAKSELGRSVSKEETEQRTTPPKSGTSVFLDLTPRQIVDRALDDARKAGAPGSVPFTVEFRKSMAELTHQREFASLPPRQIELDPDFRVNLAKTVARKEDTYIFRGVQITTNEFDNAVALLNADGRVDCSGFALTQRKIVTAGHCVDSAVQVAEGNVISGGVPILPITGRAKYGAADVGIVFLDQDVSAMTLDPLASTSEIDASSRLRVVGYGQNESGTRGLKAQADAVILSYRCDRPGDPGNYGCMAPVELIADGKEHSETCRGDSGGPAFVEQSGARKVAAIIKSGVRGQDCVNGSIYVRLDGSINYWLETATPTLPPLTVPAQNR